MEGPRGRSYGLSPHPCLFFSLVLPSEPSHTPSTHIHHLLNSLPCSITAPTRAPLRGSFITPYIPSSHPSPALNLLHFYPI